MILHMNTEIGPFEGSPTAGALITALCPLPEGAHVTVETWDSQRDGTGWRIRARWTEER